MAKKKTPAVKEKSTKKTTPKTKSTPNAVLNVQSENVVRKKRGKEKIYSIDNLKEALNALNKGRTLRDVAKAYNIPKSTLYIKSKNIVPLECRKGPKTVLSSEEEMEVVDWILFRAKVGSPVTKCELLDSVQKYFQGKKSPFTNGRPGKHWYKAFTQRHANVSEHIAQNLTTTQASVTEEDLRNWFNKVQRYLDKKQLLNIEADRVFNLDESSFMPFPKDNEVLAKKGKKSANQTVNSNEKSCSTVLFTVCASGKIPPPMVLFDLKSTPKKNELSQIPKDWGVGNTEHGWMTSESFYSYITNIFFPWLQENQVVFPVILYIGGHSSYLTLPLIKFCKENQIELVVLYPNATHIIQPLDVTIFHPLTDWYKKVLQQWRIDNNVVDFKKSMFASVLKLALDAIDLTNIIINGFESCGLYPFNPDRVDYNSLNKNKKRRSQDSIHSPCDATQCTNPKNMEFLSSFESNIISQSTLEEFKKQESDDMWSGDIKYEKLFEAWRKLKRLCTGIEPIMSAETITENTSSSINSVPDGFEQQTQESINNIEVIQESLPEDLIFFDTDIMQFLTIKMNEMEDKISNV